MMKCNTLLLTMMAGVFCCSSSIEAQLVSPQVGWRAEFSQLFHDVSGTATIIDEDTIRFDDFTFDGGGISVYFYLGESDTAPAFESGLSIGPQLVGTVYDGSQSPFTIDLPDGETLEGWNAISVWCVPAGAVFGSGSFMPVTQSSAGDFNGDGVLDVQDIDALTQQSASGAHDLDFDLNDDSLVNDADVRFWIREIRFSWIGDANVDGEFRSDDLINVLAANTYEMDVDSVWSTGDFDGNGQTDSDDLIAALADNGYEAGPRLGTQSVPEPSAWMLLAFGAMALYRCKV